MGDLKKKEEQSQVNSITIIIIIIIIMITPPTHLVLVTLIAKVSVGVDQLPSVGDDVMPSCAAPPSGRQASGRGR